MKKAYELMIILHPDSDEKQSIAAINSMFEDANIQKTETNVWGLRTLAYPIEKQNRGRYILFQLEAEDARKISELNQELRIYDGVMRHIILSK